jgi:amino acid transporter
MKHGVPILTGIGMVWATILMLALCTINIVSYKGLVRFNFIIFTFKILVIILAVFVLMSTSFHAENFSGALTTPFSMTGWQTILAAVATGGIAFAIVGSVIGCLILYLGLQVAFIGAINPHVLAGGWEHLSFEGDVGPFAGLAAGLGLVWLVKLLYIDATVSPAGAGLVYVTSTARILYAMSQIGYLPRWLQYLNKQNFPVAAILVNFVLGMFLFLPLPGWQAMVSFLVSGMVISYSMGPIALLCMRLEMPQEKRGFRLPLAKIICPFAFYFCNLLTYWCGWETIYKLAIAMSVGIVCFVIAWLRGRLTVSDPGFRSGLWMVPYLAGLIVVSYLGAFGGKNIIPFGWDFLVIGLFSMGIFYLAIFNRATVSEQVMVDRRLAAISTF